MATRKLIAQQILSVIYPNGRSDDADITESLVNIYISEAASVVAVQNYRSNIQLDSVEAVSDAFYSTFKNIQITKDTDTGFYTFPLPQPPIGVPIGVSISSVYLISPSGTRTVAYPISQRELDIMFEVPIKKDEIYYWAEGNKIYIWSQKDVTKSKAFVRMISTQSTDINATLNVPDDLLQAIIDMVVKRIMVEKTQPIDLSNDGQDMANVRQN